MYYFKESQILFLFLFVFYFVYKTEKSSINDSKIVVIRIFKLKEQKGGGGERIQFDCRNDEQNKSFQCYLLSNIGNNNKKSNRVIYW